MSAYTLTRKGNKTTGRIAVHRLVLETFRRKRQEEEVCRHLNGKHSDNRLKNLRWGTDQENADDRQRHGTQLRGETHPHTNLTNKQARKICIDPRPYPIIAKEFFCSKDTVRQIKRKNYFSKETDGLIPIVNEGALSGDKSPRSKCSNKMAKKIYEHSGLDNKELAKLYKVSEHIVGAIRRGHRYIDITKNLKLGAKPLHYLQR